MDPAVVAALVLGVDSLSGGAVLLLAVPRSEAIPRGLRAGRVGVRAWRIHRNQQLAGDDQRSGVGSAGSALLPASHARRAADFECGLVGRFSRRRVLEWPSPDSHLYRSGDGRGLDLLPRVGLQQDQAAA